MITEIILVTLSLTSSINGTGNGSYYLTNNDTNVTENVTGIVSMETNHIIEGIPDAPPALQPRFPMPVPSM